MAEADSYSRRNGSGDRADSVQRCLGGTCSGGVGRVTKRLFPAFSETVRAALALAKRGAPQRISAGAIWTIWRNGATQQHCLHHCGNASVSV